MYGLDGSFREASVPWSEFTAGFAPCRFAADPEREGTHWVMEHPTRTVRVYAPVISGAISRAHFEYDDVVELGRDPDAASHPLWSGLFHALSTQPVLLRVLPLNLSEAVFVSKDEYRARLPSWADGLVLVAPRRADFDRLIGEAWAISGAVNAARQPRNGWADEHVHDEAALTAFTNFVTGKRGKRMTYRWGDQPIKSHSSSGTFLDHYATWVDHREFDDSIVRYLGERLRNPRLRAEMQGADLLISFGGSTRRLTVEEIGTDRYQTVRAVNEVLAPAFEVRLVRSSVDGDTHAFLLAPAWLWTELEAAHREKLERKVKRIDARDGF